MPWWADKSSRHPVGLPEAAGEPFTARADAMAAAMAALGMPERIAEAVREARLEAIRALRTAGL